MGGEEGTESGGGSANKGLAAPSDKAALGPREQGGGGRRE